MRKYELTIKRGDNMLKMVFDGKEDRIPDELFKAIAEAVDYGSENEIQIKRIS